MIPHPFIGDLSEKSTDELQDSINDLTKKLNYAYRTQNGALINQLNMAVQSFRLEYGKRMDDLYKKQNLNGKINVQTNKNSSP